MTDTRGSEIRRLRKAANISISALADEVGLDNHSYLSRIERGDVPFPNALYQQCRGALVTLCKRALEAVSKDE